MGDCNTILIVAVENEVYKVILLKDRIVAPGPVVLKKVFASSIVILHCYEIQIGVEEAKYKLMRPYSELGEEGLQEKVYSCYEESTKM